MFQAYCNDCQKTVTVQLLLSSSDLKLALDNDADVKVMHTVPNVGDHEWSLSSQDKDNMRHQHQRNILVQYAKCPNKINVIEHWLLFDNATDVRLNAQCRYCGPNVIVKVDKPKNGLVSLGESDEGYTTIEPEPEEKAT